MQAAHPVAFAGFFAHTGALDEPYERLDRTTLIMNTVAFGTVEHAARATARVRAMHTRVSGTLAEAAGPWPAGTPYSAGDPDLLLWILATLADGGATTYRQWVGPLSHRDLDRLWQDYLLVGEHFGLHPPLPFLARPLVEVVNQITIGSLPEQVRRLYGFGWDPVRGLALGAGREAVRRLVRPLLPDPLARIGVARHGLSPSAQERAAALQDRSNVAS
jgi:uncharacterized protein (DUF2236 family)